MALVFFPVFYKPTVRTPSLRGAERPSNPEVAAQASLRSHDEVRDCSCRGRTRICARAGAHEPTRKRPRMLAALEDRSSGNERCLVAIDALHESSTIRREIVHQLGLVQPQSIEVYEVDVGAQPWGDAATVGETKKIRRFAGLALDQIFERQARPARRSRAQCASM
jgi:hypothetical protein